MPTIAPRPRLALSACLVLFAASVLSPASLAARPNTFEKEIARFEAQDAKTPPPSHPVLFVGSSSIRLWNLPESFPGVKTLNRGFGGSQIADSVHFCNRIITKYRPRTIIFYAGDNDLARGLSPEQVLADFKMLVAEIHASLPDTPIVFISIKPSIQRWHLIEAGRKANALIRQLSETNPQVKFVDVEPVMLGSDGKPRKELFVGDGLHLSKEGYAEWNKLVAPYLK